MEHKSVMIFIMAMMMFAGFYSYKKLPIDAFPDVSPNLVQIFTSTEGLAPEEIEKYITFPLEVSVSGLPKVKKVRSISNFGLSIVNIYFDDDMDIYLARQLVGERLTEAREKIPASFGEPELGPISTGMGLILFYYLEDSTGKYSLSELRSIQDWIVKTQLQSVPGVTEVLGIGGYERQFDIKINPEALVQYNLTLNEVIRKIENNNQNSGAQFIEKNSEEYTVRSLGMISTMAELESIVITTREHVPVFLNQIATVSEGANIRRGLQTMNGIKEVISGMVVKLYGSNSSTVISRVEKRLEEINKMLPQGVSIIPYYEQKALVEACVHTVISALSFGILFVVLVLFLFMKAVRPSIVVALSIPFSVMFTMMGLYVYDISANLMSMGGIAIAIGMMVDGPIVIVENIDRIFKQKTGDKRLLIQQAFKDVLKPIIFSISIVILVFVPLFSLQGVEGKTFKPLAYSVAFSMFGSLLYTVFFAPVISYLLIKQESGGIKKTESFHVIQKSYREILHKILSYKYIVGVIAAVMIILAGSLFLPLGSEFTPRLQEGTIVIRMTMAPSISLTESKRMTQIVEKRLMEIQEIETVISRIGRGEIGAHSDPVNSAEMFVLLKNQNEWRVGSQQELEQIIREELGEIPGALINFTQPIAMSVDELLEGVRAELAIKLFGADLDTLKYYANNVAGLISNIKGANDVQVDQVIGVPQLQIRIKQDIIGRYGLDVSEVQSVISTAVGGKKVGQIYEGVKSFDIVVRYEESARNTEKAIRDILITNSEGAKIPLKRLADINEVIGPRLISREDAQRFITIQCNVKGRDIGGFVDEARKILKESSSLPAGYYVTWGGQYKLQQDANERLLVVIPVTLAIILFLLYVSLNSLKNTVLIFINIPLAMVGGVIALWVSGQNLSVPSSVGFITLFGTALGNGMVMISFINALVNDGADIFKATLEGAVLRLRPILMTASTTGLGLIPLLISTGTGSEVQRPLAAVVIGGILSSTLLTLFIFPVLYRWAHGGKS